MLVILAEQIFAATFRRRRTIDDRPIDHLVHHELDGLLAHHVPPGVEIFEINGPFFFGVADKLQDTISIIKVRPKVFILRMRKVPVIDATGLHALNEFRLKCRREGIILILSGVQQVVAQSLERYGLIEAVGADNMQPNIEAALKRASLLVGETPSTA